MIYLLNGVRIHPEMGFRAGDIQYPAGWLSRATTDELSAIGVQTRNDEPMPDQTWYISAQNPDGTWNSTSRDLTQMRDGLKQQIKNQARNRILQVCPEWKQTNIVARGVEVILGLISSGNTFDSLSAEIKQEIVDGLAMWTSIKNIRAKSAALEAEIDSTIDDAILSFEAKIALLSTALSNSDAIWID